LGSVINSNHELCNENGYLVSYALLDSYSETSFITEKCAQSLGLHKTKTMVNVVGSHPKKWLTLQQQ
jgi:Putative peptidase (DUF1758).